LKSTPSLNYNKIKKTLGITFKNKRLLRTALTHSSAVGGRTKKSNETLEFLGDAVLELIVRHCLYKKFPRKNEGDLSELKKAYTSEDALYRIGRKMGISRYLFMDKGEETSGGRKRPSNISCTMEALIGALFLDRGLSYAQRFVLRKIMSRRPRLARDHKSLLNQWAMSNKKDIVYAVTQESGPPHARRFRVALMINGRKRSSGIGASKKKAEQDAARKYMKRSRGASSPPRPCGAGRRSL
jgi:ribonuclease-3